MRTAKTDPVERFWRNVQKTDGCWNWLGTKHNLGYGLLFLRKRPNGSSDRAYAHRFSYELAKGKIPNGLYVCHKCDNPNCVNPDHLFVGTQSDNMTDCSQKGRLRPGNTSGENNGLAKLTEEKVRYIRAMRGKRNYSELAREFGVSHIAVRLASLRKTWRHVD